MGRNKNVYALQTGVHTTLVSFDGFVYLGLHENTRFIELIFVKFNIREFKKKLATYSSFFIKM
jgi:hypothetical protein